MKIWISLLILLCPALSFAEAQSHSQSTCAEILVKAPLNLRAYRDMGYEVIDCTKGCPVKGRYFKIKDPNNYSLQINVGLDEDGLLKIDFNLRDRWGQRFNPLVRGSDIFAMALRIWGSKVKAIRGQWVGDESDNLKAFNLATKNRRISFRDAAYKTWTGQQAYAYGFTRAELSLKDGRRGNYEYVEFFFLRPQDKKAIAFFTAKDR